MRKSSVESREREREGERDSKGEKETESLILFRLVLISSCPTSKKADGFSFSLAAIPKFPA